MRDNRPEQLPAPRPVVLLPGPPDLAETPRHPPPAGGSHTRGAALPQGRAARAQGGRPAARKAEHCGCACVASRWLDPK